MGIIKRLKWKDKTGKTTDYDLGAKASNVEQDATHRFVSDTEKQTWNGKADPEDIPSGSAADYGVANNDTTNRTDMLVTAQVAYQHGKEIDQLNSEINGVNGKLYNDSITGTTSMSLKDAAKHVCDNYVGLNSSARGRFNCAEGWYDYDLIKSADDYCSGIINGHTQSVTYSCYRSRGADAVLKKLGSNIVYIGNSTSIDVKTVLPNDYANLTVDNFVVELASLSANGGAANTGGASYPHNEASGLKFHNI